MMSFGEYKRILGDSVKNIPDDEIRELRRRQYQLADMALDAYFDSLDNENLKIE